MNFRLRYFSLQICAPDDSARLAICFDGLISRLVRLEVISGMEWKFKCESLKKSCLFGGNTSFSGMGNGSIKIPFTSCAKHAVSAQIDQKTSVFSYLEIQQLSCHVRSSSVK